MSTLIGVGVIGLGKIARDQHLPAIRKSPDFELSFIVDPAADPECCVPQFRSIDAALAAGLPFDAVSICTPPQPRGELCKRLLETGCAMLLEKPPMVRLADAQPVEQQAKAGGATLFAAWHSRYSPHMAAARTWAQTHTLQSGAIEWRENAAKWHPGQGWLWQAGGFGVFDPGINALSILTMIYPGGWKVDAAEFQIPANAGTPVAADLELSRGPARLKVALEFHTDTEEVWTIHLVADNGDVLELSEGGSVISIGGETPRRADVCEYDGIYKRFAELVRAGETDFDLAPLEIVEDAFRKARIIRVSAINY